ncbi:MAG TPA: ATP-binding protein [Iamia sp.]|nr:ATP-binding protein [Iamia sp.]
MLVSVERRVTPLERGVLGGQAVFRYVTWAWMGIVLYVSRRELAHPYAAVVLCGATAVVSLALGAASRWRSALLFHPAVVAAEVGLGTGLLVADGWVYDGPHRVSLGSAWPISGALAAGIVAGPSGGIVAGTVIGLGRWGGTHLDAMGSPGLLSLLSTTFLYALAGGAAGLVMRRLQQATDEIAAARAREDIARTLHDGVLQTLAVVQRRSTDSELATLARTQERELREFLFGIDRVQGSLLAELRHVAATATARHGMDVEVTAVDDPGVLADDVIRAVAGAVGEALTNAAKHGAARRVVVFVDPDDERVQISVNDDGAGFDVDEVAEGVGLGRSIRGRVTEVGGRVRVRSTPGRGTEVRLTLPISDDAAGG